jgi:hypothetical protein
MGTGDFSQGVKQNGHEADHSPFSGAEIKNGGIYIHSPNIFIA